MIAATAATNEAISMNNERDRLRLPITMNLADGHEVMGDLIVNIGGTMERTLNNETKFVLFGDLDGSERMIAKSNILAMAARKATKAVNLPNQNGSDDNSPYAVLGIDKSANDDQIRDAFVARAKAYHPDRFNNVDLPREVAEYTQTMSRRINEAYAMLMQGKTQEIGHAQVNAA